MELTKSSYSHEGEGLRYPLEAGSPRCQDRRAAPGYPVKAEQLASDTVRAMAFSIMNERRKDLDETYEVDLSYGVAWPWALPVNAFAQRAPSAWCFAPSRSQFPHGDTESPPGIKEAAMERRDSFW